MSHPWLSHLPFTTSTSSSSFTLLSTTQEHAAQSVQQEQRREHPVHHAHLQAPSVNKLRHQESLWREVLQSGGNPRTTTPQSPKSLRLSQESKLILEILVNYMMYRKFLEKKITELLSLKKWRNLEKSGRLVYRILKDQRRLISNRRCVSTIPWKAWQILISKMESYKRC